MWEFSQTQFRESSATLNLIKTSQNRCFQSLDGDHDEDGDDNDEHDHNQEHDHDQDDDHDTDDDDDDDDDYNVISAGWDTCVPTPKIAKFQFFKSLIIF